MTEHNWTAYVAMPGERRASEEIDVRAATRHGARKLAEKEAAELYGTGWRITRIVMRPDGCCWL